MNFLENSEFYSLILEVNLDFSFYLKALPCILSKPCQNGATCTNDNIGGYKCSCVYGYTGTNCQYGMWSNFIWKVLWIFECVDWLDQWNLINKMIILLFYQKIKLKIKNIF